jgi:hypothetical protein
MLALLFAAHFQFILQAVAAGQLYMMVEVGTAQMPAFSIAPMWDFGARSFFPFCSLFYQTANT